MGEKGLFGAKRGVGGIMGMQMGYFGANRCVGGEKRCRGILGCLGFKCVALRCLGVKGFFGIQMGCFEVFGSERGVWGRKWVSTT